MKKSIFILLAAVLLVSFSSNAQSSKTMTRNECQAFLESFCLKNYDSMFDRYFFKNSLIIDNFRVLNENGYTCYEISGRHSFKNSSTHNDCEIRAKVIDKGYSKYEVTIKIQRYVGVVPTYWDYATRIFYY
ncbi:MAG: hypothetical protein IKW83_09780 [Muribaculaceae bacterium]|nr:hypothetical protein [Muribaculaceae bacterium]